MKLLMISKACCTAAYRRKLEELAAFPNVELTLLTPPCWRSTPFEPGYDRGYRIVIQRPVLNGHFHLHFYPQLPELLSEVRPDIVHIDEEPYDLVTAHALRVSLRAGAAALFFTWQNIERRYPPPFGLFEARTLRRAHAAIAGSRDAADILRRKGYHRPLYVIPQFGIDPAIFSYLEPDAVAAFSVERPFRVGFSGRLVEEKGLLVLMEAMSRLPGPWELRLIGDGPLRQRLTEEAAQRGIEERVRFAGSVPSDAVAAELHALDALVMPSLTWTRGHTRWKEQFGRSIIEAMACGVPVVGSDSGEIPNVIGEAGLVTPEGDAHALQEALRRLMESAQLRLRLASAGRERVLQHYTQHRIAEQTMEVYRQLLT